MKNRLLLSLIMTAWMSMLSVWGGTITTTVIFKSNLIRPEYWSTASSTTDNSSIIGAINGAENTATSQNYSAGWKYTDEESTESSTYAEFHDENPYPPYYIASFCRITAYYTIDLTGYTPSNGYKKATVELKWTDAVRVGGSPFDYQYSTYRHSLPLGKFSQLQCFFPAGWYSGNLSVGQMEKVGYAWNTPQVVILKEEADHQPTNQPETLATTDNEGDPINVQNGNVSLDETDASIPTPNIPLAFNRTYGSLYNQTNILGSRWTHSWDWQVFPSNTVLNGVTNQWLIFRRGVYTSFKGLNTPTNSGNAAHATTDDGFQWTAATNSDGTWNISLAGGLVASFNTNGLLFRLGDSWSNAIQVTYSNQLPIVFQHSNGKSLTLEYTNALLSKINTPSTNLYLRYFYSTNGLLTNAVTYADGKSYSTVYQWDISNRVITQRINAIGDIRCWEYDGQKGTRSWVGTNRWYDTSVALPTNGSSRSWITEYQDTTNVVYAWDANPIFQKIDQISGPMPFSMPRETDDNGTNIITVIFCSNNTNELEGCKSNIYFQALDAEYGLVESASQRVSYPIINNTYDDRGNLTSVQEEEYSGTGARKYTVSTMGYDSLDRMTNFGFSINGNPTHYTSLSWDDVSKMPSQITDPSGHVVSWVYTNGMVAKESAQVSGGINNETIYGYSTNGLLITLTNANGHFVNIAYDSSGNPTSMVPQEGPSVELTWTTLGYLNEIKMPSQNYDTNEVMIPRTTALSTDLRGFVNSVTWADGLKDYYYRDAIGQVTSRVDWAGRKIEYAYLPTKKLSSITRHLGSQAVTTKMEYNKQFNALKITDPLNRPVESYQLDNQSRPVKVSNVASQTMEIAYWMGDRINSIKRFDGTTVSNSYNDEGLLSSVSYPGETVTCGYGADSLLTTAANPIGTVTITYDGAHQITSVSNATPNGLVSYAVDGLGQPTSTVWNGIESKRDYSAAEQLTHVQVPSGDVYFSWNGDNGLLGGISNAAGLTAEYSYNSMEQVTGISWRNASGNVIRSWSYTRGSQDLITEVVKETGERIDYGYDEMDQLTNSRQWSASGELLTDEAFSYDLAGNRTAKTSGGLQVNYTTGSGDNLNSWKITSTNLSGNIDVYGVSSEPIGTNNRYGTLYVSNAVAVVPDIDGTNFNVHQMSVGLGTQQIVCAIRDMAGNMGYATGTVVLSVVTSGVYSLDSAGCVTNIGYSGSGYSKNTGMKWNSRYQLTEVTTNGVSIERNGYDAFGRRAWNWDGTTTNYMVYDGVHVLAEVDSTGGVRRAYAHGSGFDAWLTMTVYTGATTKTYYYITDYLGTVHALVDETGAILESYRYDAWGRVLGVYNGSGTPLTESAIGNKILWQGREYSWKTGLYYFRARWYDPVTGRWLSNDPIGISGGLNQYVFCANNSVNFIDPAGLRWFGDSDDGTDVGRAGTIISDQPGGAGEKLEKYFPAMETMGKIHDPLVGALVPELGEGKIATGVETVIDLFVNVPTMPVAYVAALITETVKTPFRIIDALIPDKKPKSEKYPDTCK